ncbi:MAG: hypothetical protein EOM68_29080, partial [Spirochaetia bacterium]|nr:hypothetical protein [Spirochaetia bacterium]
MIKQRGFYTDLVNGMPHFKKSKWVKILQTMTADWLWDRVSQELDRDPWSAFTSEALKKDLAWDTQAYDARLNTHFKTICEAKDLRKLKDILKWLSREDKDIETGLRIARFQNFAESDQRYQFFWNQPKRNSWVVLRSQRKLTVGLPLLLLEPDTTGLNDSEVQNPHQAIERMVTAVSVQLGQIWNKAMAVAPELAELRGREQEEEIIGFLQTILSELFDVVKPEIVCINEQYRWQAELEVEFD